MLELFFAALLISLGFVVGSWFKAGVYDNQPWEVFRWDYQIMAYRPIPMGAMLPREDKIILARRLDSDEFPAEGIRYEFDDEQLTFS